MARRSLFASALFALLAACSSGDGGSATTGGSGGGGTPTGGTTGGGGGMAAAPLAYKPCDQAKRVGGFAVELKNNAGSNPFTQVGGAVKNGVDPRDVWDEMAKEGDCRLMVGRMLVCTSAACSGGKICGGSNMCVDEPTSQDLGTVTLTGGGAPVTVTAAQPGVYYETLKGTYPPFAPEAEVTLKTTGGKFAPISLAGRGIEPLQFAGTGLKVARNQPLPITWTASSKNKSARIHVKLDIAHHGGIAARIECDAADSGSLTIPGTLITKLMDRGLAGFPSIALTRQTVDSGMVSSGCVEFAVASEEARDVEVEGVISCNTTPDMPTCMPGDTMCKPCPTGMVCGEGFRCK